MDYFRNWLINTLGKSYATAYKYSRAVASLSEEYFEGKSLFSVNTYEEAINEVDFIFAQKGFVIKNNKGHNMYSCALNNYLLYMKDKRSKNFS